MTGIETARTKTMRRYLIIALSITVALTAAIPGPQRFAGTWQARFQGTLICTIKVEAREKLSGALYGCSIPVNNDGDLIEADPPQHPNEPSPITNLRFRDNTLTFEVNGGSDVMKFELVLTAEDQADLRFLEVPFKIKPIHFERK